MKRFLTTFMAIVMAFVLCCSVGFAAWGGGDTEGDIDLGALSAALGISEEDLEKLTEGELDLDIIDLGQIDLGAVVEAVGMTQEEAIEALSEGMGGDIDLSGIDLSAVDVAGVVESIGLTKDDLQQIFEGNMESLELNPFNMDVGGFAQSVGLDKEQAEKIIQSTMEIDPAVMEIFDVTKLNLKALAAALGLTPDEMLALVQGELDYHVLKLSNINLPALLDALGMNQQALFDLLEEEIGIEGLDLSVLDLYEVDLSAAVEALGLTEEQIFALIEGELDPTTLDFTKIDVFGILDGLGLTVIEAAQLGLGFAGLGHIDLLGIAEAVAGGAMLGLVAAGAAVLVIIILLAVIGRKKRCGKPVPVEGLSQA